MLPTPDLGHILPETYLKVYEPAGPSLPLTSILTSPEDTFILLDALEKDIPLLRALTPPLPLVVEIGSPHLPFPRKPSRTASNV